MDKVIIVSGGTYGLGRQITLDLARRGCSVVAFGLSAPQVSSVASGFDLLSGDVEEAGLSGRVEILEADVSSSPEVGRVVASALERFGRIDGLVNNAAVGPLGTVLTTDESTLDKVLSVNIKGPFLMSKAVIPELVRGGGGSIVNVGSGAGHGKPNMAAYAASKGAVLALSASMAYDHFHDHVRVNTVIPGGGGIVSGMSLGRVGGDEAVLRARRVAGTAAGRPANGQDLANVVSFLLSDEAVAISGTVVDVGCFAQQGGPVPNIG
ncbi:SDR family NAD(P)-dependent oxidoreductase [Castellaniella sp. UC4442_H9]